MDRPGPYTVCPRSLDPFYIVSLKSLKVPRQISLIPIILMMFYSIVLYIFIVDFSLSYMAYVFFLVSFLIQVKLMHDKYTCSIQQVTCCRSRTPYSASSSGCAIQVHNDNVKPLLGKPQKRFLH